MGKKLTAEGIMAEWRKLEPAPKRARKPRALAGNKAAMAEAIRAALLKARAPK